MKDKEAYKVLLAHLTLIVKAIVEDGNGIKKVFILHFVYPR